MDELTKYKVVLNGTVMPNQHHDDVIAALCKLFHSRRANMQQLLAGKEVPLKKQYNRLEAEKICQAIRAAGAQCKLLPVVETPQAEAPQIDEKQQHTVNTLRATRQTDKSELMRFIGPNADFYAAKFDKFGALQHPRFRLSWHWPALFAFFFWALYRKLWAWAGIYQLTSIALVFFTKPSVLWLLYFVVWAVCANYIYYRHICQRLHAVDSKVADSKAADSKLSAQQKAQYLARAGGVSKLALWIGLGVAVAVTIHNSSRLTSQLLQSYEQQYGGSSVAANQLRGDGSVLQNRDNADPELGKTSQAMNQVATLIKLFIVSGDDATLVSKIDALITVSENNPIKDAWGKPIDIKREQRRIVISSSGHDGVEKTDDDILQFLNY